MTDEELLKKVNELDDPEISKAVQELINSRTAWANHAHDVTAKATVKPEGKQP